MSVNDNAVRVYQDLDQRSPEWFEARRGIVTASSVGTLITPATRKVASNDTSRALIAQLASERITGLVDETWPNADMQRGIDFEPYASDYYAQATGADVSPWLAAGALGLIGVDTGTVVRLRKVGR